MNNRNIDDVLLYVYIAQNVNKRGVLEEDCKDFLVDIYRLIREGQIQKKKWYSKEMFVTTYQGGQKSEKLVRKILEKNKENLLKALNNFPIGFLCNVNVIGLRNEFVSSIDRPSCFLVEHVLMPTIVKKWGEYRPNPFLLQKDLKPFPFCLFEIKKVANLIKSSYSLFESKKLAVRAHHYHIGPYGQWLGSGPVCIIIPKEVEEFVGDFISSRVSTIDSSRLLTFSDFSPDSEFYKKHRMYHFFGYIEIKNGITDRDTKILNKKLIIKKEDYSSIEFDFTRRNVEEVLQLFEGKGAIGISDELSFKVKSLEHYDKLIYDTFFKPLVDRFLGE